RGTLMAVAFDLRRYELDGSPVPLVEGVMQAMHQPNTRDETLAGQYDVAKGTLIFLSGGIHPSFQTDLVWVDRTGNFQGELVRPGSYYGPRLSGDGKHVAYVSWNEQHDDTDVWVYDVEQRTS